MGARVKLCSVVFVVMLVAPGNVFGQPAAMVPGASQVVESGHLVVAVSHSGNTVYAYSDYTGQWAKVAVEPGATKPIRQVVGEEVACFVSGTKAYAFGARSGQWVVADLHEHGIPVVNATRVRIDVQSRIYLFSTSSKKWAIVDLSKD